MKINIHDKFKSWRHFIDVVKRLYRKLDENNLEVKSLCIYANVVNKETQKCSGLCLYDKDGNYIDEVGMDIGYFEWLKFTYDGMIISYKAESNLLNQQAYQRERSVHKNTAKYDEDIADFENNYLPVICRTKGGKKRKVYKKVSNIKGDKFDWKYIKQAIDEGKLYRGYKWESEVKSK